MSFDINKAKEIRARQLDAQKKNKKKRNDIVKLMRNSKKRKNQYINQSTSPINNYSMHYHSTVIQHKTFLEFVNIHYSTKKVYNYDNYPSIKQLAIGLFLISLTAYTFLKQFLELPHERTEQKWISDDLIKQKGSQFEISNVDNIIENYIKDNNIKSDDDGFKVVLAVDAFSVKPNLIVEKNGVVRGTIYDEQISIEKVKLYEQSILEFEKFSQKHKKYVIRDTFVYLVKPIESQYPCFILHLSASTQGKATIHEIDTLLLLTEKLKLFNISVVCFGFDGDTTDSKLVKKWNKVVYNNFLSNENSNSPIESESIKNFSPKVAVDPLHILKRWRYRIFKGVLMQFFTEDKNFVNIQKWKEIFDIQSNVLMDKHFLKMNDDLPLKLFHPRIISMLYNVNDKSTLSYFIVPSLFELSLKFKTISKKDREV